MSYSLAITLLGVLAWSYSYFWSYSYLEFWLCCALSVAVAHIDDLENSSR